MGYWQKEPDLLFRKGMDMFGKFDWENYTYMGKDKEDAVVTAFLDDNNLVEMTITSACVGFSYTFQKRPRVKTNDN